MSPVRRRGAPQEPRSVHRRPGRDRSQREFYVVVEGEVTEPSYMEFLNAEFGDEGRFFIHPIKTRNGMKPLDVVQRAIAQIHQLKLELGGEQDIADERVQVWVLFDCDQHPCVVQAFAEAGQTVVHLAFSHPSFDLWLLLHFQNLSSAEGGSSETIHAKLRAAHPAYATFAGKGGKSVTDARAEALRGRQDQAAKHARKLVDDCPSGSCSAATGHGAACPPLARDPSTDMFRLLGALRIV